ncbi:hypothetical protein GQ43DRAFT_111141 [Delitschia confertaspora ATCC 74209]|uniref:Uncharacterized protein n=1 Tax=Delitschia confertaspora ATCC 74209 TaxID=1513339 RepID=A0A9P4JM00_9PLEO|nr:hypothetical protein GQ43DRAFT_111141 [Delitschia confertaspora ATCC 74209]
MGCSYSKATKLALIPGDPPISGQIPRGAPDGEVLPPKEKTRMPSLPRQLNDRSSLPGRAETHPPISKSDKVSTWERVGDSRQAHTSTQPPYYLDPPFSGKAPTRAKPLGVYPLR